MDDLQGMYFQQLEELQKLSKYEMFAETLNATGLSADGIEQVES